MKPISAIIHKHIPQFIRLEYPNFVKFIIAYYEWAEQEGRGFEFISNLPSYMDVDETSLELLEHFASVYLSPLPNIIYERNNLKTLIKNIVQHYLAKGSEKSFKFLFRLIDNTNVNFYYPSDDMLRISNGKWTNLKSVKILNPPDDVLDWMSGVITGKTSEIKAVIDYVTVYYSSTGIKIAELFLQQIDVLNLLSSLVSGEEFDGISVYGESFSGTIISEINSLVITNAGKYYKRGIKAQIDSATGIDSSIIINSVTKGAVEELAIVDGGTGYAVNDKLVFTAKGFGSGAYGKVSSVNGSGVITEVSLSFGGHDYSSIPAVSVISLTGSGAVIMAESDGIGRIKDFEIRNFGLGYLGTDTIDIPTMRRIYNIDRTFNIGETITGNTSTATGIIESWDQISNILGVRLLTSTIFLNNETFVGADWGGSAQIYDQSTATLSLNLGAVCNYAGKYLNRDGHISSTKYIQDSYFYQVFSYMIKTFTERSEWIDYIKPVHPAGMISFGYREVPNKQLSYEFYGGFFGPILDTIELYKFCWTDGNTLIKQYANIKIDTVADINTSERDKTNFCFGSEITFDTIS